MELSDFLTNSRVDQLFLRMGYVTLRSYPIASAKKQWTFEYYQNDGHESYADTWTDVYNCKNAGSGMLNNTTPSPQPYTQKGKQQPQIVVRKK